MKSFFLLAVFFICASGANCQQAGKKLIGASSTVHSSNAPCTNIDFESVPLGTLAATSGWTVSNAYPFTGTTNCWTSSLTYSLDNRYAIVAQTPIFDNNCNNVAPSPLGGQQILVLNKNNTNPIYFNFNPTKLAQNFSVTANNFNFRYAYKVFTQPWGHLCCDAPQTIFNFYDCNNNLISAVSKTVTGLTATACPSSDLTGMVIGTGMSPNSYNSNWMVCSVDLSPYIGSCITVEVISTNCGAGGHQGYCYYDADCAGSSIWVNNDSLVVNNYTSCSATATLAGMGFSNYAWQGPPASGVSGSTLSLISTSVAGIYTLNATNGIYASTQTLNLSFANVITGLSLSSSAFSICSGASVAIQSSGNGISTYSWSTGATQANIVVSPTVTTQYSLQTVNSAGCVDADSVIIKVFPVPQLQLSVSANTVCQGQAVQFSAFSNVSSFFWNTGASTSSFVLVPALSSVYSVTVISNQGCSSTSSASITVLALPQIQVSGTSSLVCNGESVTLSLSGNGSLIPFWNTGAMGTQVTLNPSLTSVYIASVTGLNGCVGTASQTVQVFPITQVQISASSATLCLGETVQLTAGGAGITSYTWNGGSTMTSLSFTPSASTSYSISGTDGNGCKSSFNQLVVVNPCTGIEELEINGESSISIFPNPATDAFTVKSAKAESLELFNELGQFLMSFQLLQENKFSYTLKGLPKGVYFVRSIHESYKVIVK